MDQLRDFSDSRLMNGCIYCGGMEETRDHVPSRVFLDKPYPTNLPVVPACINCNNSFSSDEEYVACLIEVIICSSTELKELQRKKIRKILARQSSLKSLLKKSIRKNNDQISFKIDKKRVENVLLKLARGHAAFELSSINRQEPTHLSFWPLHTMTQEDFESFDAPHILGVFGEVGSRSTQRTQVIELTFQTEEEGQTKDIFLMNDWIEVQENRYKYLAFEIEAGIAVHIVIGGYLGCQIIW